ncbi:MAG TPA: DUF433 domain-containing protein [Armatimonadota bacterium]|nr:DUF433 domain-containing protein [Armatimonadota bacterium]
MNTAARTSANAIHSPIDRGETWISKTPGICGGEACIRHTRIPVWLLVEERRLGFTDDDILNAHPLLLPVDLHAAADYYEHHDEEIEQAIQENEKA